MPSPSLDIYRSSQNRRQDLFQKRESYRRTRTSSWLLSISGLIQILMRVIRLTNVTPCRCYYTSGYMILWHGLFHWITWRSGDNNNNNNNKPFEIKTKKQPIICNFACRKELSLIESVLAYKQFLKLMFNCSIFEHLTTVFSINIWTWLLIIHCPKFKRPVYYMSMLSVKQRRPWSATSDLNLHCWLRLVGLNIKGYFYMLITKKYLHMNIECI